MHDHLILIYNEKVKNTEEVSGGRLYTEGNTRFSKKSK